MLICRYAEHTLISLAVICGLSHALLKCDCRTSKCIGSSSNCTAGTVMDQCGCCTICAKGEGEACGGLNHVEGECGHALQCMVRDVRNWQNRMKRQIEELVGRCEHVACHTTRCPVGQSCVLLLGRPTCRCPLCRDMIDEEVCGESNGKLYRNECELRREECLTGAKIGMGPVPCLSNAASRVACTDDSITVEMSKSYLGAGNFQRMSLLDPKCVFQQNATHIYQTFALNECGSQITYTLTSVVYSNVVRTLTDPSSIIIRHRSMQVPFECDYSLRSRNKNRVRISTKGNLGKVAVEELRAHRVGVRVRNKRRILNDTHLSVDINYAERYLVELKTWHSSNASYDVVPTYCFASPVHKSERWMKYSLVEQGCPVETGVTFLESSSSIIRLTVPSISFRGSQSAGFLVRCKIKSCFTSGPEKGAEACRAKCDSLSRGRRALQQAKLFSDLLLKGKTNIFT